MLVRLRYAIRSAHAIGAELIDEVLNRSQAHNPEHGITGVLCVHEQGDVFMQVVEGGRKALNRLYNNLQYDSRHRDVTLLEALISTAAIVRRGL